MLGGTAFLDAQLLPSWPATLKSTCQFVAS